MKIALWVILHDAAFLRANTLDPEDFPRGASRYIVVKALETWEKHRSLLTPAIFGALLEDEKEFGIWGTTQEEVEDVYVTVYKAYEWDENDLRARESVAEQWLRMRRINRQLDDAYAAAETGDAETAEKALNRAYLKVKPQQSEITLGATTPREKPAIPLGIKQLDKWWKGGIHLGQLGVIMAPSNAGKSMILPFFTAQALFAGKNVIYYTTELPDDQIYRRILSAMTQTSLNGMDTEDALAMAKWKFEHEIQPKNGVQEMGQLSIRFRDMGTITALDIAMDIADKREEGFVTHMVILDGDDIGVAGKPKFDNAYGMFFYIYGQLAALAYHENISIWTAAQATRKAIESKGRLGQQHMGDSLWKIRKADMVLALRMGKELQDAFEQQVMQMVIVKDRYYGSKDRDFLLYPKFGYEGAPGIVGFDEVPESALT